MSAKDEPALTSLIERAREFGYRCWRMETPYFHQDNFNRRDADIFDGGAALALLAIPEEVEVTIPLNGCVEAAQAEPEQFRSPEFGSAPDSGEQGLLRFLRKLTRSGQRDS